MAPIADWCRKRTRLSLVAASVLVVCIAFVCWTVLRTSMRITHVVEYRSGMPSEDRLPRIAEQPDDLTAPKRSFENITSARQSIHIQRVPSDIAQSVAQDAAAVGRSSSPAAVRPALPRFNATIVVRLSGEMANNLVHIAHGYCIQFLARKDHGIEANLVLQHQQQKGVEKWRAARRDIHRCFPNLRPFDFELGNTREASARLKHQKQLLRGTIFNQTVLQQVNDVDWGNVVSALHHWKNLVSMLPDEIRRLNNNDEHIRYPFVVASAMYIPHFVDRCYTQIRHFLTFDENECCAQTPDSDESVLVRDMPSISATLVLGIVCQLRTTCSHSSESHHRRCRRTGGCMFTPLVSRLAQFSVRAQHYRNFVGELGPRAKRIGFGELSTKQTANELFSHLKRGDKVAITSRIQNAAVRDIVGALRTRGLRARAITGQSGVQDFCFLMKARKELAGMARSTYAQFAAYLGDARIVRLAVLDVPSERRRNYELGYNWTHSDLKGRIRFPVFASDN